MQMPYRAGALKATSKPVATIAQVPVRHLVSSAMATLRPIKQVKEQLSHEGVRLTTLHREWGKKK